MSATTLKFKRIAAGHYATPDGTYAVVVDGYEPSKSVGADAHYEGFTGGEWAAIYDPRGRMHTDHEAGDTLDWFSTKREAVAHAQAHAARVSR